MRALSDAAGIQQPPRTPASRFPPRFFPRDLTFTTPSIRGLDEQGQPATQEHRGGAGAPARGQQGNNMSMLRYYTDDSPGLKITPVRAPFPVRIASILARIDTPPRAQEAARARPFGRPPS